MLYFVAVVVVAAFIGLRLSNVHLFFSSLKHGTGTRSCLTLPRQIDLIIKVSSSMYFFLLLCYVDLNFPLPNLFLFAASCWFGKAISPPTWTRYLLHNLRLSGFLQGNVFIVFMRWLRALGCFPIHCWTHCSLPSSVLSFLDVVVVVVVVQSFK